uniref:Centromere protein I n=1 Tax=Clastoptera arizonana TaxID=38151 RepID=A0A1B6CNL7_9HEMI
MGDSMKTDFDALIDILNDNNKKIESHKLLPLLRKIEILYSLKGILLNDGLRLLARVMCLENLAQKSLSEVVKCMIPGEPVCDDILEMCLVTVLRKQKNKTQLLQSKIILQWILSVLDMGFARREPLMSYYHLLYPLLAYEIVNPYVCKLIYKLTKSSDVSEITTKEVLLHYENYITDIKSTSCMEALLKYFYSVKTVHIPKKIIKDNIKFDEVFQKLPQESYKLFSLIYNIIDLQSVQIPVTPKNFIPNKLIPAISYILPPEGRRNLSDFESFEDLGSNIFHIAIPDQILSLLQNKVGYVKLISSNETEQKRFDQVLLCTLQKVFIRKQESTELKENELFLDKVYDLCCFMQQGIPSCNTFLKVFMPTWSGYYYSTQIFKLLEWAVIEFSDLLPILKTIHTLFVASVVDVKCIIISTLTNLIGNMIKYFYRFENDIRFPFLKSFKVTRLNYLLETLQKVISFVKKLIQIGLFIENGSIKFLDSSVSFHEMVVYFEKMCSIPQLTIASKGIFSLCIFNLNINFLDRFAGLLLMYREQFKLLEARQLHHNFEPEIKLCNSYANDMVNYIWRGEFISRHREGIIFNVPQKIFDHLLNLNEDLDLLFELKHHFSLALEFMKRSNELVPENLSQIDRHEILEAYTTNIVKLLQNML